MRSVGKRSRRALAVVCGALVVSLATLGSAVHAEEGRWNPFGFADDPSGNGWSSGFDRSFAKQWEMHPPKGFPTLSQDNLAPMRAAIKRYDAIVKRGGWQTLPMVEMGTGQSHAAVQRLRELLILTGDLEQQAGISSTYDYYVERAVKRFQTRHGLTPTGNLDKTTILAMNVPASARLRQLRSNLARVASYAQSMPKRYVAVNIPAQQVEAVLNDQIVSRHSAVVGKVDRQTPILNSAVHEINFNPTWTLPPTVISKDLIPKGRELQSRGKSVLEQYGIDAYDGRGRKLDPTTINWNGEQVRNLMFRQEPGEDNPLGFVKINFHNQHSVYMHDTPSQTKFGANFRADSSGCIRVQNVQELVRWILQDTPGWTSERITTVRKTGERMNVNVRKPVPLYFVYITAWATVDGEAHFRRDLYRRDGVGATASAY